VNRQEIKREARYQAGLLLMGELNGWEPDDLIERLGQDTVHEIAEEVTVIARKMIEGRSR
jgi:hypothetical protein